MNIYAHPVSAQHQYPLEKWMQEHDEAVRKLARELGLKGWEGA